MPPIVSGRGVYRGTVPKYVVQPMCSSCVSQPRRERSSNIQRAKELSVKNNAMSTAATSFVFVFFNVFFCASPTLVNFTVSLVSDLAHSSTNQHMNDAQRHTH